MNRQGKPNFLGHIIVDLKRHVPELSDMSMEEARALGLIVSKVIFFCLKHNKKLLEKLIKIELTNNLIRKIYKSDLNLGGGIS